MRRTGERTRGVLRRVRAKRSAVRHFARHADAATPQSLLMLDCFCNSTGFGHPAVGVAPLAPRPHRRTDRKQPHCERCHTRQRQPASATK